MSSEVGRAEIEKVWSGLNCRLTRDVEGGGKHRGGTGEVQDSIARMTCMVGGEVRCRTY